MQRLLIALSSWFSKLAKQPQVEYNEYPKQIPSGAFVNQTYASLEVYTDEIFHEEEELHLTIQYVCACGQPVYRLLTKDFGFACEHCDSICVAGDCPKCKNLFSVDFGDPNANL